MKVRIGGLQSSGSLREANCGFDVAVMLRDHAQHVMRMGMKRIERDKACI
jgi:hypothetical protein